MKISFESLQSIAYYLNDILIYNLIPEYYYEKNKLEIKIKKDRYKLYLCNCD